MKQSYKALSGRVIVQVLDESFTGILHLPETRIERAGSLCRCKVISSGVNDIPEDFIVYCFAHLGYRIPMSSFRIYLLEDVLLIEDFPSQLTVKEKSRDARDLNKLTA